MVISVPSTLKRELDYHNNLRDYGLHNNVTHEVVGEYEDRTIIRIKNDIDIPIKLNREQRRRLKCS